jgi:U3 small nucleolar RNA-associated protein 15
VIVLTVLEELLSRQGLSIALAGRDETTIEPLLSFISRYMSNPRYTSTLIRVANSVCDLYGGVVGQSDAIDELFHKIHTHTRAELEFHREIMKVLGAIDCVIAASKGVRKHDSESSTRNASDIS